MDDEIGIYSDNMPVGAVKVSSLNHPIVIPASNETRNVDCLPKTF